MKDHSNDIKSANDPNADSVAENNADVDLASIDVNTFEPRPTLNE